jgi:hypothetical protein
VSARRSVFAIIPVALLVLTACGSGGESGSSSSSATSLTAEQVTSKLIEKIPSVTLVKAYTSADDPNHQLGRPNGYTSKTAFADSRVEQPDTEFVDADALSRGGSVEVYPDEAGAKARKDYIVNIGKNLPLAVEYDYVQGGVLIRVAQEMTPEQAAEYEAVAKTLG